MPRSTPSAQDTTTSTDDTRPLWDGSPTTLGAFLVKLESWLIDITNYRTLISQRTVMYRTQCCVINATHCRLLITDNYPDRYNFKNPAPSDVAHDVRLAPTPPAAASTLPPIGRTTTGEGEEPSTLAPTPSRTPGGSVDMVRTLTAEESTEYLIRPKQINLVDSDLLTEILGCIPSLLERKERRAASNNSGTTLLHALAQQAADAQSAETTQSIENDMVDLMSSGIPEATVASFSNFRELYCTYNESLEVPLPEATIASRLAIVSRRLGTKIDNKLDARLESQKAKGNLAATVKVIVSILADAETEAKEAARHLTRAGGGARALAATDPTKTPAAADRKKRELDQATKRDSQRPKIDSKGDPVWHEGMLACRHCKKRGHLNKDCPDKPVAGKAKLARADEQNEFQEDFEQDASMALFFLPPN